jgi:aconitate hydratase
MLLGADNAFTGEIGKGINLLTQETSQEFAKIARDYQKKGQGWVIIGDENYGEGSSREHAAMSPRYLGCTVVVARSFARIHETNLKKQGILALTFMNASDYEKIRQDDRLDFVDLKNLKPGVPVTMNIHHSDGTHEVVKLNHSYSQEQIQWFKAGSALNLIRKGLT